MPLPNCLCQTGYPHNLGPCGRCVFDVGSVAPYCIDTIFQNLHCHDCRSFFASSLMKHSACVPLATCQICRTAMFVQKLYHDLRRDKWLTFVVWNDCQTTAKQVINPKGFRGPWPGPHRKTNENKTACHPAKSLINNPLSINQNQSRSKSKSIIPIPIPIPIKSNRIKSNLIIFFLLMILIILILMNVIV